MTIDSKYENNHSTSPLHQPTRHTVSELDQGDQGSLALGGIETLLVLGALHGHIPGGHVPADGQHLGIGEFEPPGEQHNDGFLSVTKGEAGEVIYLIARVFLSVAVGIFTAEDSSLSYLFLFFSKKRCFPRTGCSLLQCRIIGSSFRESCTLPRRRPANPCPAGA